MTESALAERTPTLQWSEALSLELTEMDQTHREFVELLAAAEMATDADLLTHFSALIDHTADHFGREDAWMRETHFSSTNCHAMQHQVVLDVMREGLKRGTEQADLALVRQMCHELGLWFPQHAQSMDAALALHLRRVGYDAQTGQVHLPEALPKELIQGCGGSCGEA